MNKYILLIVLLFLVSGRIAAQSVTVDAKIDSLQILIGEQAKVQLQVAMDAKQRAVFPSFTDTLVRGVEIPPLLTRLNFSGVCNGVYVFC